MDAYSSIDIKLLEGATGTLTLKVGETVLETIDDVDGVKYYDNTYQLSLEKLGFGVQEVTVIWNDGKGNILSRTGTVNSTYVLGDELEFVMYGEREILIDIPNDVTGQVIVGIDGVNYTADRYENPHDGSVFYSVMLHENLAMGKHNVTITILNDAKYPKLEFKNNLTVKGEILVPSGTIDKTKDEIILTLPENANGALSIKIGKYIEASLTWIAEGEAQFENGIAKYSLKNLDWEDISYSKLHGQRL